MDYQEALQVARDAIAEVQANGYGELCSVYPTVYNSVKKVHEPSDVPSAVDVPFTITFITRLHDPVVDTDVQQDSVSFEQLRLLACPVGRATLDKDYVVASATARYQVVEVLLPDNQPSLEVVAHGRKL